MTSTPNNPLRVPAGLSFDCRTLAEIGLTKEMLI